MLTSNRRTTLGWSSAAVIGLEQESLDEVLIVAVARESLSATLRPRRVSVAR